MRNRRITHNARIGWSLGGWSATRKLSRKSSRQVAKSACQRRPGWAAKSMGSDKPSFLPLGRRLQAGPGKRSPHIGSSRPEARQGPCPTGPSNALVDCFRTVSDPGFEHIAKGWQQQVRFERRFIKSIRYTSASLNECSGQEDSCTSTPKRSAMQPP